MRLNHSPINRACLHYKEVFVIYQSLHHFLEALPKINKTIPKIPIKIVTFSAPESVNFPEEVAGMLGFLVGVAEIDADGVAVTIAEGVAVKAGSPPTLSAAKTVNERIAFWKTLFSSVYSNVIVCTPGSRPCGGVHDQFPFLSAFIICVNSIEECTDTLMVVPAGAFPLNSGELVAIISPLMAGFMIIIDPAASVASGDRATDPSSVMFLKPLLFDAVSPSDADAVATMVSTKL